MHNSTVLVGKHVRRNATVLYLYLLVLFGRAETYLLVLVRARRIMFEVKYGNDAVQSYKYSYCTSRRVA